MFIEAKYYFVAQFWSDSIS